jgi:hypothetical protein
LQSIKRSITLKNPDVYCDRCHEAFDRWDINKYLKEDERNQFEKMRTPPEKMRTPEKMYYRY